ncbi:MAG: D-alanine--D-alanine ligase [Alphaproteobacteria bacterium MarineAlpha6_Bin4]|nr:MAG: D-alanine--D-alanine ligase [Alphaproteobacteria bacterium MarineAlpha6_Bin3]PPR38472.1 MAG: D-alanine--D-alanine ligase [Alphaproteobacteria bacterium MarineAlpha6_Bin4]
MKKKKIVVLLGGVSAEKNVSLKTGKYVSKSLKKQGYQVKEIKVTSNKNNLIKSLKEFEPDFVFNALHGYFGEDGKVQKILDKLKLKYSHSNSKSSEIAMDKKKTKLIFNKIGVPYPKDILVNSNSFNKKLRKLKFKYPLVIKPVNEGSSLGVKICKSINELKKYKLKKKINYMIEEFIPGRELTVGILNNKALDIIELKTKKNFYDYKSKYTKGMTKYIIPASIPKNIENKCKKYTEKIHKFLKCKGVTRTDFRFDQNKTLGKDLYVLEINTQPGMTPLSLVPKMAKYKGVSFDKLIENIIGED